MRRGVKVLCVVTLVTSVTLVILVRDVRSETVHDAIQHSLGVARAEVEGQKMQDEELYRTGVDNGSGGSGHNRMLSAFADFRKSQDPDVDRANILLRATRELRATLGVDFKSLFGHPLISGLWPKLSFPFCPVRRKPRCVRSRFQTMDGSCNNLDHPRWGMSNRAQKRYLPPHYADDVGVPRIYSVTGGALPSPRLVSNVMHRPEASAVGPGVVEPVDSVWVMQWGQLLDHDLVLTPGSKGFNGADIMCCGLPNNVEGTRSACFPIAVPEGDPVFKKSCMNFVRSAATTHDACLPSRREQLNMATAYIDASYMYGADEESARQLRTYSHGHLKMTGAGFYYPDNNQEMCIKESRGDYCMKSGDKRIHVFPGLAASQVLFLREHNRLSDALAAVNPGWDDERLYQEARKIVIALNQHITYTEYLERIIGPSTMKALGLYSKPRGYNTVYRPEVDVTLANSFAAAAFRFGHSQIPGNVNMRYRNATRKVFRLEETFNRPRFNLADGGRGTYQVNRWMYSEPGAMADQFLEPAVRDRLFLDTMGNSFDLASLNIQRGRDHGLPGYNSWRRWCGLPAAKDFRQMPDLDPDTWHRLEALYSHPDDVDLFTGGLAERRVVGGAVGPTFSCILGRQFKELKYGDRFWYENDFSVTGFTEAQLNSIKTQRLSNILCNNQNDEFVPLDSFSVPSIRNQHVACRLMPQLDLWLWQEGPVAQTYKGSNLKPPPSFVPKYGYY